MSEIAVATAESLGIDFSVNAETPEDRAAGDRDREKLLSLLDSYLEQFARPELTDGGIIMGSVPCLKCGKNQTGFLGSFEWGLIHGEGRCSNCGWPGRGRHYVKDENGEEVLSLNLVLQYHPDRVGEP